MELVWIDPDDGTILLMHLPYLACKQPVAFYDVVVELVPFRQGGNLGAREVCERMEEEAVDDQASAVKHKDHEVGKQQQRQHFAS